MSLARNIYLWVVGLGLCISALVLVWSELGHHFSAIFDEVILQNLLDDHQPQVKSGLEFVPPGTVYNSEGIPAGTTEIPWLLAAGISLVLLFYLHGLSLGQTSPLAAGAFVVTGPLLAVVVIFYHAIGEAVSYNDGSYLSDPYNEHFSMVLFGIKAICFGVICAGFGALFAAVEKRDEWFNHCGYDD